MRTMIFSLTAIFLTLGTCGCSPDAPSSTNTPVSAADTASNPSEMPKELIVSIIPAENSEEGARAFEPMRVHLEKELGIPVKVFPVVDYSGVIEAMRGKKVDLAWFGPLAYVVAEREADAEAFAVQVKPSAKGPKGMGEPTYKSLFVVPGNSPAKDLADLKGKRVAFVDPLSTSGGIVPTLIIKKRFGVMPDKFFDKVTYAGGHDAVEMAVKNKSVDAGATDDVTYDKMVRDGKITPQSNRIINTSEPLPGAPFAWRKSLPETLKAKIRDTFLNAHKELKAVSGDGTTLRWDAGTPETYEPIREMVKELELQQKDLLK